MNFLFNPPFRNERERDEAIIELQEMIKKIIEGEENDIQKVKKVDWNRSKYR